jgi:hypothetical protein
MKFAAIKKGTADVRPIELTLPWGETIRVGVRPLPGWDDTAVFEKARAFAKARGVEKPTDEDPVYVMGIWVHTLLASITVFDSDEKGEPFFADVDEILKGLDRDRISYLYEQQQRVQEEHGMRADRMTEEQFLAAVHECVRKEADDPSFPFWKWGPTLRVTFMRRLAVLLWNSHLDKSLFGASSGEDSSSDKGSADG